MSNVHETAESLLNRFVEQVLNGHSLDTIDEIFSTAFRDNDPFSLPPLFEGSTFGVGTRSDVRAMVEFFASDLVDVAFNLEELIANGDRIAYRLFGEGVIRALITGGYGVTPLSAVVSNAVEVSGPTSTFGESRAFTTPLFSQLLTERDRVLGDRIHLAFQCVGILHQRSGRFVERWGPWLAA